MTSILLMMPIALGAHICGSLEQGYTPKQAVRRAVESVSDAAWDQIPTREAAGQIGRLSVASSIEQCPQQWRKHRSSSATRTTFTF